jgi:transposase
LDRKTVRKYIARGLEPPAYKPRKPRAHLVDGFMPYVRRHGKLTP